QTDLVFRPAQQFLVKNVVGGLGKRVIQAHGQILHRPIGDEALHAVRHRAAHVDQRTEVRIVRDQILDVVAKVSGAESNRAVLQRLLETEIVPQAAFRLQIWVGEEKERRKILK